MPTIRRVGYVVLAFCCAGISGCGSQILPAPITREEQVRRLSDWSRSLETVKAKTVPLGGEIKFRNEKGEPRQENIEATLLIQQYLNVPGRAGHVLLLGRWMDKTLFEAGRNDAEWWFASYLDPKTAWIGDARKPLDAAALGTFAEGISPSLFRADLALDLLGLSPLPAVEPGNHPEVTMRITDDPRLNTLALLETRGGKTFPAREIAVDRRTGNVQRVRLNDPNGVLVESKLSVYRPVTNANPISPGSPVPQFPRQIQVTYPGQQMSIKLEFESVEVPSVPPKTDKPDFQRLGLTIIPLK